MIPDTSLFSNRSQKVIVQHSICLFLQFQNVNQLKGKTNTRLMESYPVKMKLVTTLSDTLLKIKAI